MDGEEIERLVKRRSAGYPRDRIQPRHLTYEGEKIRSGQKCDQLGEVMTGLRVDGAVLKQAIVVVEVLEARRRPAPRGNGHRLIIRRGNRFELPYVLALVEDEAPRCLSLQRIVHAPRRGVGQHARNLNTPGSGEGLGQLRAVEVRIELRRSIVRRHR